MDVVVERMIVPTTYCVLAVIGIFGNGLVIYVMTFFVKTKSVTDVYVTNLSIADLLFVSTLPFWAHELFWDNWIFGDALCKILSAVSFFNMYGSIFFLTAMGLDRWLAVVQAVQSRKTRTVRRAWINTGIVWTVCLIFTIFPLAFRNTLVLGEDRERCAWIFPNNFRSQLNVVYALSRTLIGFVIPLSIILYCYISILVFMRKRSKNKGKKYKGLSRITKMVALVIICFVIAWLPNQVTNFTHFMSLVGLFRYCPTPTAIDVNATQTIGSSDHFISSGWGFNETTTENFDQGKISSKLEITQTAMYSTPRYRTSHLNPISETTTIYLSNNVLTTSMDHTTESGNFAEKIPEEKESSQALCIKTIRCIHMVTVCLGFANSVMNPIIYACVGSALRTQVSKALGCFTLKQNFSGRSVIRSRTLSTYFRSNADGSERTKQRRGVLSENQMTSGKRRDSSLKTFDRTSDHGSVFHATSRLMTRDDSGKNCIRSIQIDNKEDRLQTANNPETMLLRSYDESEPSEELFGGVWVGGTNQI
uniref:somatostatin receptor type 2-like isoform X1 n=1 Tax=Styela clava TaxID=7725 RepID=UPI00193A419D|nr:somatostatin receptor type 2-like isoform X1 [Styela clava]XP_039259636.1 somatostatin receptor type 2-like isoform X1 [Styela clava]